jgi:DMSO reductase family type II enzyme heme b subunit
MSCTRISIGLAGLWLAVFTFGTDAVAEPVAVPYLEAALPEQPGDGAWSQAPEVTLTLSEQQIVPPVGGGGVGSVRVRALHDGSWLAIRLEWSDDIADRSVGVDTFRDAAAVGFPVSESDTPASPFMGDEQHPINIWQWTADLEAAARGEGTFAERYPHTTGVWYFPQDAAVHRQVRSWRGHDPVVEFVATGWGTLQRRPTANVLAMSQHAKGRWSVVLRRRLQTGSPEDAEFKPGETSQLIVAIWDGSQGEVNGRKSITLLWTPLVLAPTVAR